MQSGTTGINAIRIYNPIKQGIDHDPDGIFIKKWVHELQNVPKKFIHMPW
jgi:deoxyribodipyrimidine photo-lyase